MRRQSLANTDHAAREKRRANPTSGELNPAGESTPLGGVARAISSPPGYYTPRDLLALQRTMGNRQVTRIVSQPVRQSSAIGRVQRLAMSEQPIEAMKPKLTSIKQLVGGHKGDVYLLVNQAGQKLVVKFQNEATKEAIIGTMIMEKAGAATPRARVASSGDMTNIHVGFGSSGLLPTFGEVIRKFLHAESTFKNILLMDFAEGQTIMKMMEEDPQKCAQALKDRQFQFGLGRILAADAIAGNPDRAMALGLNEKDLKGWYHEQNLFINEVRGQWGNFTAVAIDNAFSPSVTSMTKPFGRRGVFGQIGSLAAASPTHFATESGLIYDRMLEEFTNKHPNNQQVNALVADLRKHRDVFVSNVTRTAEVVMNQMIGQRQQGWKGQLEAGGARADEVKDFRERKRYMRLIKAGCDPTVAHDLSNDRERTRRFLRLVQFGCAPAAALNIIDNEKAYRKFLLRHEKGYSRLKTLIIVKRGDKAYHKAMNK